MTRFSTFAAASIALAAISAAPALAHAEIESATLADGAVVSAAPAEFSVTFGEPVAVAGVGLKTSDGSDVALDFTPAADPVATFIVPLPALEPGGYALTVRALGDDGHVMTETLSFTVDPHAGMPGMSHDAHAGMDHAADHGDGHADHHGDH